MKEAEFLMYNELILILVLTFARLRQKNCMHRGTVNQMSSCLGQAVATDQLDRVDRLQGLSDFYWLSTNSPAFKYANSSDDSYINSCVIF
jgi:hypothetical protein